MIAFIVFAVWYVEHGFIQQIFTAHLFYTNRYFRNRGHLREQSHKNPCQLLRWAYSRAAQSGHWASSKWVQVQVQVQVQAPLSGDIGLSSGWGHYWLHSCFRFYRWESSDLQNQHVSGIRNKRCSLDSNQVLCFYYIFFWIRTYSWIFTSISEYNIFKEVWN